MVAMEQFYRKRLERLANGHVTMYHMLLETLLASCSYITDKNDIQVVTSSSGITYHVLSQHGSHFLYEFDVAAGACTCLERMSGKRCKHEVAVFKWFDEVLPNMPPTTDPDRYATAQLALGELTPPDPFT